MSAQADELRGQAREILSGRGYSETDLPRPFEDPLRWIGDRLRPIGGWIEDRFYDVAGVLPGGSIVLWLLIGAAVLLAAVLLARRSIRRREGQAGSVRRDGTDAADDARELERAAEAAERSGDWEAAVRLRFRAGVARLGANDVVDDPRTVTTGQLAARLDSAAFEPLGRSFDAIAYGGRPAQRDDADAAREGWPAVLEESKAA